jgi:hypothetical protein
MMQTIIKRLSDIERRNAVYFPNVKKKLLSEREEKLVFSQKLIFRDRKSHYQPLVETYIVKQSAVGLLHKLIV